MFEFLRNRWFLLALVGAIFIGLSLGTLATDAVERLVSQVLNSQVRTAIVITVLFLMSITLNGNRLAQAFLSPLPISWALIVNAVCIPLMAAAFLPLQQNEDLAIGLLAAACVPTTMAAASVWTRRAGGNDAISLMVTMLTNSLCFLVAPFWLNLLAGATVELDASSMMRRLLMTALLPIVAGQFVRLIPVCARLADRHKTPLGVAAQIGVLLIVFESACSAALRLSAEAGSGEGSTAIPGTMAFVVMTLSCLVLHLLGMLVANIGSRWLRFSPADRIAVMMAGSQKTLPIGALIATDEQMLGQFSWAVCPILMYHAIQLFVDTPIADWHREKHFHPSPPSAGS